MQGKCSVQLDAEYCVSDDVHDINRKQAVHDVRSRARPVDQAQNINIRKYLNKSAGLSQEDHQRNQHSDYKQGDVQNFHTFVAIG